MRTPTEIEAEAARLEAMSSAAGWPDLSGEAA